MSKQTLINELTKEVNQAEELLAECIKSDESEAVRYSFLSAKRAYSHALDLANYHIHDGKESVDINHIESVVMNVINDLGEFIKPSREANAFVFDMLKKSIRLALKEYNLNGGWVSVDDELPYCHTVSSDDWYEDWHTNKYCPLQIVTKDNMLRTAVFLEMKIQDFHGEKLFWLCDIENLSGKFVIHEISDDFLEIDEVKYWQPMPQPPKEQ